MILFLSVYQYFPFFTRFCFSLQYVSLKNPLLTRVAATGISILLCKTYHTWLQAKREPEWSRGSRGGGEGQRQRGQRCRLMVDSGDAGGQFNDSAHP